MYIPITACYESEEFPEDNIQCCNKTECNCCKVDPNTNQRGACICTDCKCHLRARKNLLTDPVFLYGVLSVAIIAIGYLVQK